jgi:glyoxylase-like metal-dependent hydrolase (beta-lactamase superfamily II)
MHKIDRRAFFLGATALFATPAFARKRARTITNHWAIGNIVVHRIVEIEHFVSDPARMYDNLTAADVRSVPWLHPHYATPEGQLKMSFQAFLVRTPDKTILVDTCLGGGRQLPAPAFSNLGQGFLDNLAKVGITPEEVDIVLCTHMHYDHVGWNTRLRGGKWVPTFARARHLFSKAEYDHTKKKWKEGQSEASQFADTIEPVVEAGLADFINPAGYQVCKGVRLLATPGHSPGHYSVELMSRGQKGAITGDMIHSPAQLAFPQRYTANDGDKALASRTRQEFFERFGDGRTVVFGSHFPPPTAGHIVRAGNAWRFVPL